MMKMMRIIAYLVAALTVPPDLQAQEGGGKKVDEFQRRVDKAIEKGASYLMSNRTRVNRQELLLYAIIHVGRKNDLELIEKDLEVICRNASDTYEMALMSMGLAMRGDGRFRQTLLDMENKFWAAQTTFGGWGYHTGSNDTTTRGDDTTNWGYDNTSTSQFVTLALHAGWRARVGQTTSITIDDATTKKWEKVATYWLHSQYDNGGWGYVCKAQALKSERRGEGDGSANGEWARGPYMSMTCAGISSLAVARLFVKKPVAKRIDTSIKKGKAWLDDWIKRVADVDKMVLESSCISPTDDPRIRKRWDILDGYSLYSLEKACDLAGIKSIGARDWYRDISEYVLRLQRPDGSWPGGHWETRVNVGGSTTPSTINTAFIILFLKRASRVILTGDKPGNWAGPLQDKAHGEFMGDPKDQAIDTGKTMR